MNMIYLIVSLLCISKVYANTHYEVVGITESSSHMVMVHSGNRTWLNKNHVVKKSGNFVEFEVYVEKLATDKLQLDIYVQIWEQIQKPNIFKLIKEEQFILINKTGMQSLKSTKFLHVNEGDTFAVFFPSTTSNLGFIQSANVEYESYFVQYHKQIGYQVTLNMIYPGGPIISYTVTHDMRAYLRETNGATENQYLVVDDNASKGICTVVADTLTEIVGVTEYSFYSSIPHSGQRTWLNDNHVVKKSGNFVEFVVYVGRLATNDLQLHMYVQIWNKMQKPKTYKLIDEEHFILRNKTGIQNLHSESFRHVNEGDIFAVFFPDDTSVVGFAASCDHLHKSMYFYGRAAHIGSRVTLTMSHQAVPIISYKVAADLRSYFRGNI